MDFSKKLTLFILAIFISCTGANQVCINNDCYNVVKFTSDTSRRLGLMYKEELKENEGALFIFEEEGLHSFWMKNVNFPIDIIWINKDFIVVDIKRNTQPCEDECEIYFPQEKALYVLELNSNSKVNIGDEITIK